MDDVKKQGFLSALRWALTMIGSSLTARGVLNDESANQLIGAVMTVVPLVWGVWDKYAAENKARDREINAYNAGATNMPIAPPPGAKP